jgi:hypothetical protein
MNKETQITHFESFISRLKGLILTKNGVEQHEDVLSVFKLSGSICNLSPQQQCLSLIALKVAGLGVLISDQSGRKTESVSDELIDLAYYTILLDMILTDVQCPQPYSFIGDPRCFLDD